MGIPTLARRLEPYATRYTPQDLNGYTAIIDGPSLAYHAHKLALAAGASTDRMPSYVDINAEAIRWLKSLEDLNIRVSTILFDGALPDSKKSERISRLERYVRQITTFKSFHPRAACPIPRELGAVIYSFLAPALREALSETAFAEVTQLVPGEADDWCSLYTSDNPRSVVFSSDTDLLLYEYPPESLVMFFRDVDLASDSKGYRPSDICTRLELPSLLPLAYAVSQNPYNSLTENLREAKNVDFRSQEYMAFSDRYTAARPPAPSPIARNFALRTALQSVDVRVSEFIHQALEYKLAPTMYLPILLEDANQASAWNMGQDIRLLAYSLLTSNGLFVREYKRKAQALMVQEIQVYSPEDMVQGAVDLYMDLRTWIQWTTKKKVPLAHVWPLFAASIVLVDLRRPSPISLLVRVLNNDFDGTWEFVHLIARIQAVVYSLRFLNQCAKAWLALNEKLDDDLHNIVADLHRNLETLPLITDLAVVPGQQRAFHGNTEQLRDIVRQTYETTGIEPLEEIKPGIWIDPANTPGYNPALSPRKQLKKQQRVQERKEKRKQESDPRQLNALKDQRRKENISRQDMTNMFAVLSQG